MHPQRWGTFLPVDQLSCAILWNCWPDPPVLVLWKSSETSLHFKAAGSWLSHSWHRASPQFLCFINRSCILPINFGKGREVPVLTENPLLSHLLVLFLFSAWVLSSVFSWQDQSVIFLNLSHAPCPYCVISPQLQVFGFGNVTPNQDNCSAERRKQTLKQHVNIQKPKLRLIKFPAPQKSNRESKSKYALDPQRSQSKTNPSQK